MSSDDRMPQVGKSDGAGMTGVALLAGLLALLASTGCGGSTSANGGGGASATISGTIAVGTGPSAIALDSTTNKIYVTDFGTIPTGIPCSMSGAAVEAIDGATQAKTSVGFSPLNQVNATHAALNPVSHKLYVQIIAYWNGINGDPCVPFSPGMEVFDTTSLQPPNGHIFVAAEAGIDVNSVTRHHLYHISGVRTGAVFVDDSNMQWLATIPVGSVPIGVAVNATSDKIYVANKGSNNISVIDGASSAVVATVTDPNAIAPVAVAVNATTNTIYVVNSQSNNLSVIDGATNTVTATIPVGTSPSGVAVDSQSNFIYVANAGNSQNGNPGNVTVINGTTNATATLSDPTAKNPVAIAANSATNKIYIANSGSNNVTVINGAQ